MSGTLIQIGLVILGLLGLGGMFLKNQSDQRKAGRDAEHSRQADAAAETQRRVDQAVGTVGSLSDDAVRDELRASLGPAAPGASPPVQPRSGPGPAG